MFRDSNILLDADATSGDAVEGVGGEAVHSEVAGGAGDENIDTLHFEKMHAPLEELEKEGARGLDALQLRQASDPKAGTNTGRCVSLKSLSVSCTAQCGWCDLTHCRRCTGVGGSGTAARARRPAEPSGAQWVFCTSHR